MAIKSPRGIRFPTDANQDVQRSVQDIIDVFTTQDRAILGLRDAISELKADHASDIKNLKRRIQGGEWKEFKEEVYFHGPVTFAGTVSGIPAGAVDHGTLTGLTDDDHTQYVLADGTRALTGNWDVGAFYITATRFISDIAIGTAPLTVTSTTLCTNLNADLLDSQQGSYYLDLTNATNQSAIDHGSISGLADDDHTQYLLIDGTRDMTGDLLPNAAGTLDLGSATDDWALAYIDTIYANVIDSQSITLDLKATVTLSFYTNAQAVWTIDASGNFEPTAAVSGSANIGSVGLYPNNIYYGGQLVSSVATGTAPMTIASTTLVSNLNADLLDGQEGSYYLDLTNATTQSAIDHGSISGLSDDDHTQYLLVDGTRDMTGNLLPNADGTLTFGGPADRWQVGYFSLAVQCPTYTAASGFVDIDGPAGIGFEVNSSDVWNMTASALVPATDNTFDIGSSTLGVKDIYYSGSLVGDIPVPDYQGPFTVHSDDPSNKYNLDGHAHVAGGLYCSKLTAGADSQIFGGLTLSGDLLFNADNAYDIGTSSAAAKDAYFEGVVYSDVVQAINSTTLQLLPNGNPGAGISIQSTSILSNGTYGTGDPPGPIGAIDNPFSFLYASGWSVQNGGIGLVGGTNYERVHMYQSTDFFLLQESGGTGTVREFNIGTAGASALTFQTAGTDRWSVDSSGHLVPAADDTYDIGTTSFGVSQIFINDGSATNPSLAFSDDSNTGIYRSGGDALSIAGDGKQHAEWYMNSAGNYSNLRIQDANTENYLNVLLYNDGGAGVYGYLNYSGPQSSIFYIRNEFANDLRLGTATADRWTIDGSGHFYPAADDTYDIGSTSNGVSQIFVNNGTAANPSYAFSDDPDVGLFYSATQINATIAGTAQVAITDGTIEPTTDDDIGLGTDAKEWSEIWATPHAALFRADTHSSGTLIWDTTTFNTNTTMFTIENSSTEIHVNSAGYYRISFTMAQSLSAGTGDNISLYRNAATQELVLVNLNGDSSSQTVTQSGSIDVYCSGATDYFRVLFTTGGLAANNVYNTFSIERLN